MVNHDLSSVLTEEEQYIMQQVRDAKKPIEDPTVLVALFNTVERLATKIQHMRENEEEAAQAIKDYLALQQSSAEVEHGHNSLNSIADDLFFDEAP